MPCGPHGGVGLSESGMAVLATVWHTGKANPCPRVSVPVRTEKLPRELLLPDGSLGCDHLLQAAGRPQGNGATLGLCAGLCCQVMALGGGGNQSPWWVASMVLSPGPLPEVLTTGGISPPHCPQGCLGQGLRCCHPPLLGDACTWHRTFWKTGPSLLVFCQLI